jgi:hypothetical protein
MEQIPGWPFHGRGKGQLANILARRFEKFDPNQPRDEDGKWTSDGGGGGAAPAAPAAARPAAEPKPAPTRQTGSKAPGAPQRVSTSMPSAAAAARGGFNPHQRQDLQPSFSSFKQALSNPKFSAGTEKVLDRYGNEFLRLPANATVEQKAEAFVEHSKSNIVALYKAQNNELRERSKVWYEGANKIAGDMAQKYGVSQQAVAGVMASLSPQRDWDQNVELADRVLKVAVENKDVPFTGTPAANARSAMLEYRDRQIEEADKIQAGLPQLTEKSKIEAAEKKISNRREMAELITDLEQNFEGKTLGQLPEVQQPVMLRFYDQGNAPEDRAYTIWNPEGTSSGEIARNKPTAAQAKRGEEGDPKQSGWGGFDSIGNSLSVLRDDSNANISASLGDNHKVRNFYNNIISPNYGQDTTIDTHAVAASMLMPLGQSSPIVKEGLGMSGPKNADTGLKGMYALHYEAYTRAAAEISQLEGRQVLPREMQSSSWEALRGLYNPEDKRNVDLERANRGIWKDYQSGKITLAAAQERILARGIRPPRWAKGAG